MQFADGTLVHRDAFPVVVIDSTAAGDAFAGAFAASMALDGSYERALNRGNAAGALACTVAGAQPSIPTAAAIDSLLAKHLS